MIDLPSLPFGPNALRTTEGAYFFAADALFARRTGRDAQAHEVNHRALVNGALYKGAGIITRPRQSPIFIDPDVFDVLHGLVAMSQTCIWAACEKASSSNIRVLNSTLREGITVEGDTPPATLVRSLFERAQQIESIVDNIWFSASFVLELIAIDFTDGFDALGNWDPFIRATSDMDDTSKRSLLLEEAGLIYDAFTRAQHDPPDNYVSRDAFRDAVCTTWDAYDTLPTDDEQRREVLRYALANILKLKDTADGITQVYVQDSLLLMQRCVAFLKDHGPAAVQFLRSETEARGADINRAAELLWASAREGFGWLPTTPSDIVFRLRLAIRQHLATGPGLAAPTLETYDRRLVEPTHFRFRDSLLSPLFHFIWSTDGERSIEINSSLVKAVRTLEPALPAVPDDWWRQLLLFEKLRDSFKFGQPVICPLKGYTPRLSDFEVVGCDENCAVRVWLRSKAHVIQGAKADGACDLLKPLGAIWIPKNSERSGTLFQDNKFSLNIPAAYISAQVHHLMVRIRAQGAASPGLEMIFSEPSTIRELEEAGLRVVQEQLGKDRLVVMPDQTYLLSIFESDSLEAPPFDSSAWEPCSIQPDVPVPTKDYPRNWPSGLRYPLKYALIEAIGQDYPPQRLVEEGFVKDLLETSKWVSAEIAERGGAITPDEVQSRLSQLFAKSVSMRSWHAVLLFHGQPPAAQIGIERHFTREGFSVTYRSPINEEGGEMWFFSLVKEGWASVEAPPRSWMRSQTLHFWVYCCLPAGSLRRLSVPFAAIP